MLNVIYNMYFTKIKIKIIMLVVAVAENEMVNVNTNGSGSRGREECMSLSGPLVLRSGNIRKLP